MRCLKMVSVIGLAMALAAGCGKSDEQKAAEKAAEETREAAEALKQAAESAAGAETAKGMEAFAKALEGVAGAVSGNPDGTPVDPVSVQSLQTVLPEVPGWERGKPTGERMTAPVAYSQAEADYSMGDARISVKIVDSAFSQLLVAPWAMFLTAGYEKQTQDGYEKSVNVSGQPGFERWDSSSRDGELNLVIAKRYLVTVEGRDIGDTAVLHEFASKIDPGRLESAK